MKRTRMKVYVAGAYSDNNVLGVLKNIGRGQYYASKLFKLGFAPFTPWHDKEFVIANWNDDFAVNDFYDYSMEWLYVSEAVFVVPNHDGLKSYSDSTGTQKEIFNAASVNIPIFFDEQKLIDYARSKGFEIR